VLVARLYAWLYLLPGDLNSSRTTTGWPARMRRRPRGLPKTKR